MKNKDFQNLKVSHTDGDLIWCYCYAHEDLRRPNLSVSITPNYYGRYKCWACGVGGYMTFNQMKQLIQTKKPTLGYIEQDNKIIKWHVFIQKCQKNLQRLPLIKMSLAKQLNISCNSIDKWSIGYDGSAFTVPMYHDDLAQYDTTNHICGVHCRFPDGSKKNVKGSKLGYIYARGEPIYGTLFMCEGFSDAISIYDLGFQSIARPNWEYTEGLINQLRNMCDYNIVIIPDNNEVGIKGAYKVQQLLTKERWPYGIFRFKEATDIRELIQIRGKDYVKKCLQKYLYYSI